MLNCYNQGRYDIKNFLNRWTGMTLFAIPWDIWDHLRVISMDLSLPSSSQNYAYSNQGWKLH